MKFRIILLSFGLASWGLFLTNQFLNAQHNVEDADGLQAFSIYICGVAEVTQYSLFNTGNQSAIVINEYYQPDGAFVNSTINVIPANDSISLTVGDYVPGGFVGDAIVASDIPLTSTLDAGPGTFLIAEFTADPLIGLPPLTVAYTNQSIGYDTVLWDFGDGITSTVPSPTHTYTSGGVYTATLTIDKSGCLDNVPSANPTSSIVINVGLATADLAVSQTAVPDPVITGELLTYTLTITNNGPDNASGLVITNTLPVSVTFQSASDGCNPASNVVTCQLDMVGSSTAVPLTITILAPDMAGMITNSVTVMAPVDDPNLNNNTAVLATNVVIPEFPIYLPIIMKP